MEAFTILSTSIIVDNFNKPLTEILAEARAIRHAVQYGKINYEEAKAKVQPLLKQVNKIGRSIAKKYGRKYRDIKFADL